MTRYTEYTQYATQNKKENILDFADGTKVKKSTKEQILSLLNIKERSDIKSFEFLDEHTEDNDNVYVKTLINGIFLEFECHKTSWGIMGYLEYWEDSEKAFEQLIRSLPYQVNRALKIGPKWRPIFRKDQLPHKAIELGYAEWVVKSKTWRWNGQEEVMEA
jgi:hypothetical protein